MKPISTGKVMLRVPGAPTVGMFANWFGTAYVGSWIGSRLLEMLVRQWAVVTTAAEQFVKKAPKTLTVKKRAG